MGKNKKVEKGVAVKVGRPTLFSDAIALKIIDLAEQGKTNKQIADIIGVHEGTIEVWTRTKQEFRWSLKEAKNIANQLVEAALFARATGYTKEIPRTAIAFGKPIDFLETVHYPPSEVAAIFWLKNRDPERWRDKPVEADADSRKGPQEPDEIIVEFQDETPNKDAK